MRKASKVLGIVGGAVSLLAALLCIIGGIIFMTTDTSIFTDLFDNMYMDMGFASSMIMNWTAGILGIVLIVIAVLNAVGGVLGLVGGLMVDKKNVTAGVLMIVSAGISLLLSGNWLTMILCTLGGIFALVKEKPPVPPLPQAPVQ
jgi:hypothetical protein